MDLTFEEGELLYTHELENMSVKWSWEQFEDAVNKCGFQLDQKWTDDKKCYGLGLLKCAKDND